MWNSWKIIIGRLCIALSKIYFNTSITDTLSYCHQQWTMKLGNEIGIYGRLTPLIIDRLIIDLFSAVYLLQKIKYWFAWFADKNFLSSTIYRLKIQSFTLTFRIFHDAFVFHITWANLTSVKFTEVMILLISNF